MEAIRPRLEAATAVQTLGQQGATLGAQRMAAGPARARPACPPCGQSLRRVGMRPRTVVGWFDPYPLTRPYGGCAPGHGGIAPADAVWVWEPGPCPRA